MAVILGVDPGKAPDRFAICAVERVEAKEWIEGTRRRTTTYLVRHLERTPLGTSYPESVVRLVEIFDAVAAMTTGDIHVRIDSTGVGSPVVDLVRDALGARRRVAVTAVTVTSTDRIDRSSRSEWRAARRLSSRSCKYYCSSGSSGFLRRGRRRRSHESCSTTRSGCRTPRRCRQVPSRRASTMIS